jgi:hypothetical protein
VSQAVLDSFSTADVKHGPNPDLERKMHRKASEWELREREERPEERRLQAVEVPDLESILLPHLRSQDLLLALPLGTVLEEALPRRR